MAGTKWTELLTCPNCGQSGPVRLSQLEGRVYDFSVEAVPAGFEVVHTEYGEIFFCSACNRSPTIQVHCIQGTTKRPLWFGSAPNNC
jgi:hypothetical protein